VPGRARPVVCCSSLFVLGRRDEEEEGAGFPDASTLLALETNLATQQLQGERESADWNGKLSMFVVYTGFNMVGFLEFDKAILIPLYPSHHILPRKTLFYSTLLRYLVT
jgi:hypothetical protein